MLVNRNALLLGLMAWVSAYTGLPMADAPVPVFKSKCEIAAIWMADLKNRSGE